MNPTRRGGSGRTIAIAVVTTILVIAAVAAIVLKFMPGVGFGSPDEENVAVDKEHVIINVPESQRTPFSQQVERGSLLKFGGKDEGTPVILFADPEDLSRDKPFVGGRPSDFLTAVQHGDYYLTYFPVAKTPEREQFIQNVSKVAKCRQTTDLSTTSIFTLNAIVKAGMELPSTATVDEIAENMEADMSLCPQGIDESVQQLNGNTKYFMEDAFGLDIEKNPTALYANGSVVTDIFHLNEGWETAVGSGVDIGLLVPRGEDVAVVDTLNIIQ